jgi:hypothetical protein
VLFITDHFVAIVNKTFRIFVSSTFSDLKEERNALQRNVFPELKALCSQHGFRFQAIDLRWGVREESALDQQTMRICLDEVARCQRPPNPNFIVLLGDRYGWQPLPAEIPVSEFEQLAEKVSNAEDSLLLRKWYKRDDNALPAVYCIQSREVPVEVNVSDSDRKRAREDESRLWDLTETRLRRILRDALKKISITEEEKIKYESSATEQEIRAGTFTIPDAKEHVFSFFRTIEKLPQDERAKDFIDLIVEKGKKLPDPLAHTKLEKLKKKLEDKTGKDHITEYSAEWQGDGVSNEHIKKLCDDVKSRLSRTIIKEISQIEDKPPLEREIDAHEDFGNERLKVFVGRVEMLRNIHEYIHGTDNLPLAIFGESGTGKSALMACSVRQTQERYPDAVIIYRFIGATPESSDGRALLEGICRQISRAYGADESGIPTGYKELVEDFPGRLTLARMERPLVIFLDALDQFSDVNDVRRLNWLPSILPEHVRMIVSTLKGECQTILETKLVSHNLLELKPMPPEDGEEMLNRLLNGVKRTLQPEQKERILANFNIRDNGNPLYLKLAFEEARRWRSYNRKDELRLSPDISGIIQDLFARLSSDKNHGELIVSRSLAYLATSRNGLTEDELIDMLARDTDCYTWFLKNLFHSPPDLVLQVKQYLSEEHGEAPGEAEVEDWIDKMRQEENTEQLKSLLPKLMNEGEGLQLPVVLWSRFYADMEPYLTERSVDGISLLGFYHSTTFNSAVAKRYLQEDVHKKLHSNLADYFLRSADPHKGFTFDGGDNHALSELPYQLTESERWQELHDILTNFSFLKQKVLKVGYQQNQPGTVNHYPGVYRLQNDYDHAVSKMSGMHQVRKGSRSLFVTPVDLGHGEVIVCPWCNTRHPFQKSWLGEQLSCPNPACNGPLRVNSFVASSSGVSE